jgi:hypothetical protein
MIVPNKALCAYRTPNGAHMPRNKNKGGGTGTGGSRGNHRHAVHLDKDQLQDQLQQQERLERRGAGIYDTLELQAQLALMGAPSTAPPNTAPPPPPQGIGELFNVGNDLMYGLADARPRYLDEITSDWASHLNGADQEGRPTMPVGKAPLIVDTISNSYLGTGIGGNETKFLKNYEGADKKGRRGGFRLAQKSTFNPDIYQGETANEDPTTQAFRQWMEASKWDPRQRAGAEHRDKRVGQASKGGISKTVEDGHDIHFALDGLDMDRVVDPTHGKSGNTTGVTGQELRHIYRNREAFGDHVKFWKDGAQVDAPWKDDETGGWAAYAEHRRQKHS